ncbi:unnamed protein product [Mytilus coruscus]|uniref:Uncharacterized protein n=1 Tax=Mytilus coruscus TaxID=42192 RepID=A0A6J8EPZ4_MYTCO|nr:unnamed protein product [Mytilus coruscus]
MGLARIERTLLEYSQMLRRLISGQLSISADGVLDLHDLIQTPMKTVDELAELYARFLEDRDFPRKTETLVIQAENKLSVINKFTDNSSCVNFVNRYDKWYKTQDRGGLQKPSDSLFLLIRELETVIRKTVEPSYGASSLLINPLKEAMMEGFMVKH